MEEPPSVGPTLFVTRSHRPDPQSEPSQSSMGRTPNPWGTDETRIRAIASHGCQVHGPSPKSALPDVAHVSEKPHKGYRRCRLFCGANSFLRLVVCVRDFVARPPPRDSLRCDRIPHVRVGRSATVGSFPVEQRATVSLAGSRWELRNSVSSGGGLVEHSGSSHGAAISLAECLCRALDRFDSARVSRSCDCLQRSRFAARPKFLLRLLPTVPNSSLAGEGRANQPTDPACGDGSHRGDPASWRTPSSLRTRRRLDKHRSSCTLDGDAVFGCFVCVVELSHRTGLGKIQ